MTRLLLIDGHSVIYRSFFAFIRQPLRNSAGFNTSAVYGFARTLRKLLSELKPEYCAVVYDAPGRTFRHEKFEEYKIQRPPAPEELPPQIPIIKEMVQAWGIAGFEVAGVEADDVLGTLARRFSDQDLDVMIATSDKDLLQLVSGRVTAYDPWKNVRYTSEAVQEKLGVPPEQIPDLLALSGDASDNIPGVPGVGPKRAQAILLRWQNLDAAIESDERVRPHAELARLSRDLATIRTGVAVNASLEQLRLGRPDADALQRIFRQMDFAKLPAELVPQAEEHIEVTGFDGLDEVRRAGRFGMYYEKGAGLWLTVDGQRASFVPGSEAATIRALLEDERLQKVGHDLKRQIKSLHEDGLGLELPLFDVEVGAWLIDPNRKRYAPEDVVLQVLGRAVAVRTLEAKSVHALKVYQALEPQVLAMGLGPVANELEMPLVPVLAAMEERGVKVDLGLLAGLEQELSAELAGIEREIHRLAGHEFSIGSPKQLGQVLFDELKLRRGRRTKTGYSTDIGVLQELASQNPIVQHILRHRELTKLCNTYLGPLRELADPVTHRVHATFNQTGTATGRLSSSDPNLQNVPVRTDLGRRIRNCFVAGPGNVLVSADYSQIELRVLAHVSGDEQLSEAFRRGEDIHTWTAAAILGIAPKDVKPEDRRLAKVVNYGLVYGMGDHGLSSRAEIPIEQARAFLDGYMARFSGVARWRERIVEEAKQNGFVRTISGRMRPTPGIADRNRGVAEATKRYALNAPIQGSAADIIKRAMISLEQKLRGADVGIGMILQVHDELVFEVEESKLVAAREMVRTEMENAWRLDVPLAVDIGAGRSWGEAH